VKLEVGIPGLILGAIGVRKGGEDCMSGTLASSSPFGDPPAVLPEMYNVLLAYAVLQCDNEKSSVSFRLMSRPLFRTSVPGVIVE